MFVRLFTNQSNELRIYQVVYQICVTLVRDVLGKKSINEFKIKIIIIKFISVDQLHW